MIGPIYCQKCKRANNVEAKKCLWCGEAIDPDAAHAEAPIGSTKIDIEYLGGLEGIDGPSKVRLEIDDSGVRVIGVRPVRIKPEDIVEARVVDASYRVPGKRKRGSAWWWLFVGPLALLIPGKRKPEVKKEEYLLTVRYRSAGKLKSAVFRRQDHVGLSMLEGLARILATVARHGGSRPYIGTTRG